MAHTSSTLAQFVCRLYYALMLGHFLLLLSDRQLYISQVTTIHQVEIARQRQSALEQLHLYVHSGTLCARCVEFIVLSRDSFYKSTFCHSGFIAFEFAHNACFFQKYRWTLASWIPEKLFVVLSIEIVYITQTVFEIKLINLKHNSVRKNKTTIWMTFWHLAFAGQLKYN